MFFSGHSKLRKITADRDELASLSFYKLRSVTDETITKTIVVDENRLHIEYWYSTTSLLTSVKTIKNIFSNENYEETGS